jgi:hypothetical protein
MQMEPDKALRLFNKLAMQEQWVDNDHHRGGWWNDRVLPILDTFGQNRRPTEISPTESASEGCQTNSICVLISLWR